MSRSRTPNTGGEILFDWPLRDLRPTTGLFGIYKCSAVYAIHDVPNIVGFDAESQVYRYVRTKDQLNHVRGLWRAKRTSHDVPFHEIWWLIRINDSLKEVLIIDGPREEIADYFESSCDDEPPFRQSRQSPNHLAIGEPYQSRWCTFCANFYRAEERECPACGKLGYIVG